MKKIMIFLFGALVSGIIVWYVTSSFYIEAHDYSISVSYAVELDNSIGLNGLTDAEVKCDNAKTSAVIAKGLERKLNKLSKRKPMFLLTDMHKYTTENITKFLSRYNESEIKEFADNCIFGD